MIAKSTDRPRGSLMRFYLVRFAPVELNGHSENTRHQYKNAITALIKFVGCDVQISKLTPELLDSFKAWMRAEGYTPATVHLWPSMVRTVARHARPHIFPNVDRRPRDSKAAEPAAGTLQHFIRHVYAVEREIAESSVAQLCFAADSFGRFLGKQPEPADLTSDNVNHYLIFKRDSLAYATLLGRRTSLLTLWRALYDNGTLDEFPRRIRKLKPQPRLTMAWSVEQVKQLLAVTEKLPGCFRRSRLPRAVYWRAWILAAWESGFRLGDMLRPWFHEIGLDGTLYYVQHKTGHPIICRFSPEALEAIRAVMAYGRDGFGGLVDQYTTQTQFKDLARRAGLTGSTKYMRRSSATAVEVAHPGGAMAFLGHKTPGLAMRHYVDHRQLVFSRPQPPLLTTEGTP